VIRLIVSKRGFRRSISIFAAVVPALSLAATPCYAQQGEAQPAAQAAPAAKPQGGDSVANRITRLEQQFRDLQVSVGTLESLVRAKPGAVLQQEAPAPAPSGEADSRALGDLTSRVGALETQIGALTSQLEQINKQISALEAKLSPTTASVNPPQPIAPQAEPPQPVTPPPVQQSEAPPPPPPADQAYASTEEDTSKPRWFGGAPDQAPAGASDSSAPQPLAPLKPDGEGASAGPEKGIPATTAGLPNSDAQSLYEQGYGAMLQHDYGAAETAFRQLIAAHPNDPLAGSAQYWIGESYYVRGQYKSAADAFLKGYKKYKASDKAPDTLLKLGMSLAELGQKDAACSTFGELAKKYPQAPDHILDQAKGERKKAGC
jgi:tol-pal system protein YbgF